MIPTPAIYNKRHSSASNKRGRTCAAAKQHTPCYHGTTQGAGTSTQSPSPRYRKRQTARQCTWQNSTHRPRQNKETNEKYLGCSNNPRTASDKLVATSYARYEVPHSASVYSSRGRVRDRGCARRQQPGLMPGSGHAPTSRDPATIRPHLLNRRPDDGQDVAAGPHRPWDHGQAPDPFPRATGLSSGANPA